MDVMTTQPQSGQPGQATTQPGQTGQPGSSPQATQPQPQGGYPTPQGGQPGHSTPEGDQPIVYQEPSFENMKGGQPGQPGQPTPEGGDFHSFLPDELKENPSLANFKSVEDLARGYLDTKQALSGKYSDKIIPDETSTPEQREAFYNSLRDYFGAPETPAEYEPVTVKNEQGQDVQLDIQGENRELVRSFLHKMGLGQEHYAAAVEHVMEAQKAQYEQAFANLQQEWGQRTEQNIAEAQAYASTHLPDDLRSEVVQRHGNDPTVLKLLNWIARGNREDRVPGEPTAGSDHSTGRNMSQGQQQRLVEIDKQLMDSRIGYQNREMLLNEKAAIMGYTRNQ